MHPELPASYHSPVTRRTGFRDYVVATLCVLAFYAAAGAFAVLVANALWSE